MLVNKRIFVNISYRNVTHYLKLGYYAVIGNNLEINTVDLPIVSHQKIDVKCELCGDEKILIYHKYIENKNRHGFYSCKKCSRQKAILTSRNIYGVDNYSQLDECKDKIAKNNIQKYGVKTTLLCKDVIDKRKKTMLDKYGTDNFWEIRIPNTNKKFIFQELKSKDNDIKDPSINYDEIYDENYYLYRNEVRRLTKKSVKKLLENWNGKDYYDGEFIKDNFNLSHLDKNYPTIDHKISVYYGYKNKIDPKLISSVDNLCMTKHRINSLKRETNEKDFSMC
jgi:transcription elongation factor Elf1